MKGQQIVLLFSAIYKANLGDFRSELGTCGYLKILCNGQWQFYIFDQVNLAWWVGCFIRPGAETFFYIEIGLEVGFLNCTAEPQASNAQLCKFRSTLTVQNRDFI